MHMSEYESELSLLFIADGNVCAKLTIASDNESSTDNELPAYLPQYIERDNTKNVPFVSDRELIDGVSPITVYVGEDANLSPILLLEETNYEMMLSGKVDSAFDYLTGNSGEIALRQIHLRRANENPIYTLSFKGYVGRGYLDITVNGKRISIPFEVRSKKINYLKDYPLMLGDISEFSVALLMGINSPLHGEFSLGNVRNDTLYEDFILLDYIFGKKDLIGAYNQVSNSRYSEMKSVSENVPAGMAWSVDPSDIVSLISPDNLCKMENGPIAGQYAPLYVNEKNYRDDYDTPENRVIKDLIITVQRMVHHLIANPLSESSSYISNRLSEMCSEIDRISSNPWLNEVGELNMIPFESTVLQSRRGYSELFEIYQIIGLGVIFRQDDIGDLVRGQNNRVYQIYEYWCYTRLYRCLYAMSENKPKFPLTKTDGAWVMTIRRGNSVRFKITANNRPLSVTLYYNKGFRQSSDDFRSYSVDLRPDFTLLIETESENTGFIINLDAKYKAKPKNPNEMDMNDSEIDSDCWEFDIYKMHTYRDALIHSFGSYVLYPGNRGILYPKPLKDEDWKLRKSLVIPSVGAIPLVPGRHEDKELSDTLKSIFSAISDYSVGEFSVDPSIQSRL